MGTGKSPEAKMHDAGTNLFARQQTLGLREEVRAGTGAQPSEGGVA
ncbi:hypothetical protein ACS5PJ_05600 [Pseudarthrobacter sp. YS3]